jgi:hypothetical protein
LKLNLILTLPAHEPFTREWLGDTIASVERLYAGLPMSQLKIHLCIEHWDQLIALNPEWRDDRGHKMDLSAVARSSHATVIGLPCVKHGGDYSFIAPTL